MSSIPLCEPSLQDKLTELEEHIDTLLSSPWNADLMRILSVTSFASHNFFVKHNATAGMFAITTQTISSPMGLGSDSLPVKALIQGREIFLPDSLQFILELGCRLVNGPCYYLMPSFRGEPVDERHLCEFFHAEVEIIGGLDDVITIAESYVRYLTQELLEHASDSLERMVGESEHLFALISRSSKFIRLSFEEAKMELRGDPLSLAKLEDGTVWITPHGERKLISQNGDFIWLTHMPWRGVPFYQKRQDGCENAMNADLLAGCGEILGAGERAPDGISVKKNLLEQKVDPTSYNWYIRMKELQPLQTSGFGMGIERFLMWVLRQQDIRRLSILRREWGKLYTP